MTAEQRLERAEKQIRQLKVLIIGLVVIVVGGLALGQAKPQVPKATPQAVTIPKAPQVPDVIRAKSFEVVNEAGKSVVILSSFKLGGVIMTRNSSGTHPLAFISANDGGGGIMGTLNGKGQEVAVIGATVDGEGTMSTFNGEGKKLVHIGDTVNGEGMMSTYNGKGKELVSLGATVQGAGAIRTYNEKGQTLVEIGAKESGGAFGIRNKTGEFVVQAYADEYGMGYVGAFDRQGKGRTLTPR